MNEENKNLKSMKDADFPYGEILITKNQNKYNFKNRFTVIEKINTLCKYIKESIEELELKIKTSELMIEETLSYIEVNLKEIYSLNKQLLIR